MGGVKLPRAGIGVEEPRSAAGEPGRESSIGWLTDADLYRLLEGLLLQPGSSGEVCERIVEITARDSRVATCSIFLNERNAEFLTLAATNNAALHAYLSEPTYRVGEGVTGWVFKYRQPVIARDPWDEAECAALGDPGRGIPPPTPGGLPYSEGSHDGWLAAPLTDIDGNHCIGVLRIRPRAHWIDLDRRDVTRIQILGRLAYLVVRNALQREAQVEAAEAEALQCLTAKVAHRVGNRLYAMANQIESLQIALADGKGVEPDGLEVLRETLESARELVRNLVKQASLPPLTLRSTPMAALLQSTACTCVPCEIRPQVSIAPGAETVVCDPDQLRAALAEVIQNSVEIAGRGVRLRLEAATERGRTIIGIRDNGPGVQPELKERIFEPMYSTRAGGTGWGLVIAREIVEKHGGKITEEGTPGEGAYFVIRLPKGRVNGLSPAAGR